MKFNFTDIPIELHYIINSYLFSKYDIHNVKHTCKKINQYYDAIVHSESKTTQLSDSKIYYNEKELIDRLQDSWSEQPIPQHAYIFKDVLKECNPIFEDVTMNFVNSNIHTYINNDNINNYIKFSKSDLYDEQHERSPNMNTDNSNTTDISANMKYNDSTDKINHYNDAKHDYNNSDINNNSNNKYDNNNSDINNNKDYNNNNIITPNLYNNILNNKSDNIHFNTLTSNNLTNDQLYNTDYKQDRIILDNNKSNNKQITTSNIEYKEIDVNSIISAIDAINALYKLINFDHKIKIYRMSDNESVARDNTNFAQRNYKITTTRISYFCALLSMIDDEIHERNKKEEIPIFIHNILSLLNRSLIYTIYKLLSRNISIDLISSIYKSNFNIQYMYLVLIVINLYSNKIGFGMCDDKHQMTMFIHASDILNCCYNPFYKYNIDVNYIKLCKNALDNKSYKIETIDVSCCDEVDQYIHKMNVDFINTILYYRKYYMIKLDYKVSYIEHISNLLYNTHNYDRDLEDDDYCIYNSMHDDRDFKRVKGVEDDVVYYCDHGDGVVVDGGNEYNVNSSNNRDNINNNDININNKCNDNVGNNGINNNYNNVNNINSTNEDNVNSTNEDNIDVNNNTDNIKYNEQNISFKNTTPSKTTNITNKSIIQILSNNNDILLLSSIYNSTEKLQDIKLYRFIPNIYQQCTQVAMQFNNIKFTEDRSISSYFETKYNELQKLYNNIITNYNEVYRHTKRYVQKYNITTNLPFHVRFNEIFKTVDSIYVENPPLYITDVSKVTILNIHDIYGHNMESEYHSFDNCLRKFDNCVILKLDIEVSHITACKAAFIVNKLLTYSCTNAYMVRMNINATQEFFDELNKYEEEIHNVNILKVYSISDTVYNADFINRFKGVENLRLKNVKYNKVEYNKDVII